MKISLININSTDRTFQIHLSDITEEYYFGEVEWWIKQDTINNYSICFEIPYGQKEWTSEPIDKYLIGYDNMGNEEYMYFSGGVSYSLAFYIYSYGREEILGDGELSLWFNLTGAQPYIWNFTITQSDFEGNTNCKCLLENIYNTGTGSLWMSYVSLYDESRKLICKWDLYDGSVVDGSDIFVSMTWEDTIINGQTIRGLALNWNMLVGDVFGKKYTFYLRVDNHVRPSIESNEWITIQSEVCSASITLLQEGMPECYLNVMYNDVAAYDFATMERIGTIKDYPEILASQWNQFCKDVNVVRRKAGLNEYYFDEVSKGTSFDHMIFHSLYEAIAGTCPSGIISPPQYSIDLFFGADASGPAVKLFISNLVNTLQACRDYYWSTS